MSLSEILPISLFVISILFTLFLHLQKDKKLNLNEFRKTLREDSEKAIRSLEQKVVETEEQVSLKKVDAENTCAYVEKKIQELKDDGEELNQLDNALQNYRNMLAQLNVATSQTHDYVVKTSNEAARLQELQQLIDSHEKKTFTILKSFESGVKEQRFQFETLKTEIESQTDSAVNQIVTTRDDSLSLVNSQIEKFQTLSDTCDEIQSKHKEVLNELIASQNSYKEKMDAVAKDFEAACKTTLESTQSQLDGYLTQIQTSANDKLSLVEGSIVKDFEKELETKREDVLLEIDKILQNSVNTINMYDEKLGKSLSKSETVESNYVEDIPEIDDVKQSSDEEFSNVEENMILPEVEEPVKEPKPKKEKKKKKKSKLLKKDSKKDSDILDLKAGIDLVDLPDIEEKQNIEDLIVDDNLNSPFNVSDSSSNDDEEYLDDDMIEDIFSDEIPDIDFDAEDDEASDAVEMPKADVPSVEDKDDSKEKDADSTSKDDSDEDSKKVKEDPIKKLNGTGFGNLLNSYGSNKRKDDESSDLPKKDEPKSFKPGSIIEMLAKKDETKVESEKKEELPKKVKSKSSKKDNVQEDKDTKDEDINKGEDKNKHSYEAIGEEEEILLD